MCQAYSKRSHIPKEYSIHTEGRISEWPHLTLGTCHYPWRVSFVWSLTHLDVSFLNTQTCRWSMEYRIISGILSDRTYNIIICHIHTLRPSIFRPFAYPYSCTSLAWRQSLITSPFTQWAKLPLIRSLDKVTMIDKYGIKSTGTHFQCGISG
jgi:hypothetical protein